MSEIDSQGLDTLAGEMQALGEVRRAGGQLRKQEIVGPDNILASTLRDRDHREIDRMIAAGETEGVSLDGMFLHPMAGSFKQLARYTELLRSTLERPIEDLSEEEEWLLDTQQFMSGHWASHDGGNEIVLAVITEGDGVEVIHESDLEQLED